MLTVYKLRHFPTGEFYNRRGTHTKEGAVYNTEAQLNSSLRAFRYRWSQGWYNWDYYKKPNGRNVKRMDNPDEYELVTYELVEVMSERLSH